MQLFDGYEMHFGRQEVEKDRLEAFIRHELDANEITVLMQDVCEANLLPQLPSAFYFCATYLVEQRLVSISGRQTH
jgi:hypothetical protein